MKKYNFHKIADSQAELFLPEKGSKTITAGGKKICVSNYGGQFFACAATCPHAGGLMSEGNIDENGNIICPLHRYKFNLANGRNTSGEGYFLKTYPVEMRDDGVFVGIPQGGLFGW